MRTDIHTHTHETTTVTLAGHARRGLIIDTCILIIIITFLYSTCISSFFGSSIPTSLLIFKKSNVYIDKNVERTSTARACASPETSTCEVPRDISRKLQLNLCDDGVVEVSLLHVMVKL